MYKIGEFSKIVDLPVRTLRYYDECGILKPEYTDTFSGYRYYTLDNVYEAEMIKLLKSVDFSLEEVLDTKDNLTVDALERKKEELLRGIYLLELKCQKINVLTSNLTNNQPVIQEEPEVMVLRKTNGEGIRKAS